MAIYSLVSKEEKLDWCFEPTGMENGYVMEAPMQKFALALFLLVSASCALAGAACPEYSAPLCATGEALTVIKNDKGCQMPVCKAGQRPKCPEYSAPICRDDQYRVMSADEGGCPMFVCKVRSSGECPNYSKPLCAADEKLFLLPDQSYSRPCRKPVCLQTNGGTYPTTPAQ